MSETTNKHSPEIRERATHPVLGDLMPYKVPLPYTSDQLRILPYTGLAKKAGTLKPFSSLVSNPRAVCRASRMVTSMSR